MPESQEESERFYRSLVQESLSGFFKNICKKKIAILKPKQFNTDILKIVSIELAISSVLNIIGLFQRHISESLGEPGREFRSFKSTFMLLQTERDVRCLQQYWQISQTMRAPSILKKIQQAAVACLRAVGSWRQWTSAFNSPSWSKQPSLRGLNSQATLEHLN